MANVKRGFSPMDLVWFDWDKDTNITQMAKPATHEDLKGYGRDLKINPQKLF